jgi:PBP1b-binding outer membrane lipoprotein LpoB
MKRTYAVTLLALFFASCATYKELSPDPELLPAERGYIELKDGKDNFTLDKVLSCHGA